MEKANTKTSSEVKKEAASFLKTIDANELIAAEQQLVAEGLDPTALRHLCPAHMELLNEQLGDIKSDLPTDHPIKILMEEHETILSFLDKLEDLNAKFQKFKDIKQTTKKNLIEIVKVAEELISAENHHKREELALFPAIEKKGIFGPTQIMRQEHDELRANKKALKDLAESKIDSLKSFKNQLNKIAKFIVFNLRDHIFKENNILYPSALEVIRIKSDWQTMKDKFDKIGYCPFTIKAEKAIILDLRIMPPFERYTKIFETWEKMADRQVLQIINDHDPKPLHYQFEAELKDNYEWEYLENGPIDWKVNIKKVG